MKKTTTVREYMSRLPVEIQTTQTIADAAEAMETEDIRHIPVMQGSHLVGIVSNQDLHRARLEGGAGGLERPVSEACARDPLTVPPTATVVEAAKLMLDRGVGSAVVVDAGLVVGIFTRVDALRVVADL